MTDRHAQHQQWFKKYIMDHPHRHALLLEAVPGDDRWLNAVPYRDLPKRCRSGPALRRFKHAVRRIAFNYLDAAHPHKPNENNDADPASGGAVASASTDEETTPPIVHHSPCGQTRA